MDPLLDSLKNRLDYYEEKLKNLEEKKKFLVDDLEKLKETQERIDDTKHYISKYTDAIRFESCNPPRIRYYINHGYGFVYDG